MIKFIFNFLVKLLHETNAAVLFILLILINISMDSTPRVACRLVNFTTKGHSQANSQSHCSSQLSLTVWYRRVFSLKLSVEHLPGNMKTQWPGILTNSYSSSIISLNKPGQRQSHIWNAVVYIFTTCLFCNWNLHLLLRMRGKWFISRPLTGPSYFFQRQYFKLCAHMRAWLSQ